MSSAETPRSRARSRLIVSRSSGLLNFRLASTKANVGSCCASSRKAGSTSLSLSKLGAWRTYSTGAPPRRVLIVCCCWTNERAPVSWLTAAVSRSAISCCERSRRSASGRMTFAKAELTDEAAPKPGEVTEKTAFASGTSSRTVVTRRPTKSSMYSNVAPSGAVAMIWMRPRSSSGASSCCRLVPTTAISTPAPASTGKASQRRRRKAASESP